MMLLLAGGGGGVGQGLQRIQTVITGQEAADIA
jgi:hypothetical protein